MSRPNFLVRMSHNESMIKLISNYLLFLDRCLEIDYKESFGNNSVPKKDNSPIANGDLG